MVLAVMEIIRRVQRKMTLNFNIDKENMNMNEQIPISQKATLTIREAAEYTSIGINKIASLLRQPNCPFVLYVGKKKLVKRKEFETYISRQLVI